jgi:hypothetical protein
VVEPSDQFRRKAPELKPKIYSETSNPSYLTARHHKNYPLISHGDRRESIFENDEDRSTLLTVLAQETAGFDAVWPPRWDRTTLTTFHESVHYAGPTQALCSADMNQGRKRALCMRRARNNPCESQGQFLTLHLIGRRLRAWPVRCVWSLPVRCIT